MLSVDLEDYEVLKEKYNASKEKYEKLKKEYEAIRRLFNQKENYTDIWTFNIIGGYENLNHPTQKPLSLIRRMIMVSSRKGDTVLDLFAGTGTTSVASKQLGRNYIAIEREKKYLDIINKRLSQQVLI